MKKVDPVTDMAKALSRLRKSNVPRGNVEGKRTVTCRSCGKDFQRGPTQRMYRCPSCAEARQVEAGSQLRDKAGPVYEKMVRSQVKHWLAEALRLDMDVASLLEDT